MIGLFIASMLFWVLWSLYFLGAYPPEEEEERPAVTWPEDDEDGDEWW